MKDLEEKLGNLLAQKKQLKIEISELEDALSQRKKLFDKVEGALEFGESLKEKPKDKKEK
jgi:chaperonin cofactor prefoldin